MVKKKGKKFRPNLNHVARKRRQTEKNKKKCRSTVCDLWKSRFREILNMNVVIDQQVFFFFRTVIKKNWETSKTPRENVLAMGLAFSPNEAVPLKQPHREIIDMVSVEEMGLTEARVLGTVAEQRLKKQQEKRAVLKKEKALKVVSSLEREANEIQADRDSQPRTVRLPDRDVELLIYLAQRYGDDYKAMARDPKNLFQYTPKKISNLMKIYRSSGFCQVIESVS
ncbi:hypothetical protein Aduo_016046 [Ancylostoma duodenale]